MPSNDWKLGVYAVDSDFGINTKQRGDDWKTGFSFGSYIVVGFDIGIYLNTTEFKRQMSGCDYD